ncbi:hypothetical protein [Pandoraea anhela]|uniref:Uncharacterized protein n=1 Tax=Pandoraea anhela TaxID=2508295 RepID=A0A5E4S580_9BURK|nr:hypothetical protein [Pandoraea anhela]VVD70740.1 hypothetical protein PAN31108_00613 [Pandoraea anhela]
MSAKIIETRKVSRCEVVPMIRAIADDCESGDYGPVEGLRMVCVILGDDGRMVYGAGKGMDANGVFRLLARGQHWMNEEDRA